MTSLESYSLAVSSLIAGLASWALMVVFNVFPLVVLVFGITNFGWGLIAHLVFSFLIGLVFIWIVGSNYDYLLGIIYGLVYGLIWWMIGFWLILPLAAGVAPQFNMEIFWLTLPAIWGFLMFGVLFGFFYIYSTKFYH